MEITQKMAHGERGHSVLLGSVVTSVIYLFGFFGFCFFVVVVVGGGDCLFF